MDDEFGETYMDEFGEAFGEDEEDIFDEDFDEVNDVDLGVKRGDVDIITDPNDPRVHVKLTA